MMVCALPRLTIVTTNSCPDRAGWMQNKGAKLTLFGAVLISSLTIFAVHFQQDQERENMYKGVLRDDERRRKKLKQREEDLEESRRKRELYERVQSVEKAPE
ncbi:hypothetical protein DXG01_010220 [Tephrocybe rancida]|nr:hypothetical protein DXG01_010220 [Tephrocybe rancida]